MRRLTLLIVSIWLTFCGPALPSDFATGAAAYDGGRYAEAFATWRALADQGDTRARVAVAGMHRHGEGRAVDFANAAKWYRLAAEDGDPIAQLNYAELLEHGLGTARDRAAALRWYIRAAEQGNEWARDQHRRLAKELETDRLPR